MPSIFRSDAFKLTAFMAAVVFLGALLAPQLHALGQWIVAKGWLEGTGVGDSIERAKITRYFNRALQGSALLLAYPFVRWLGLKRGTNWLLLEKNPHRSKHLVIGFYLAAGTLLALGIVYIQIGWYRPFDSGKTIPALLFSALVTGFSVALLEEFLFRGALFGLILRTLSPRKALIFLSIFFAVVHFLKPPDDLELPPVEWDSGFWLLGQIFGQFADVVDFLLPELVLLFVVGWVLGYARLKTGSLWMSIGLHAGWVFGIKFFSGSTRKVASIEEMLPWAGPNLRVGICSVVIVILTGVAIWGLLKKSYPRSAFAPMGEDRNSGEPV